MEAISRGQALNRLAWLSGGILFWGAGILGRLIHLQVLRHKEYKKLARGQQEHEVKLLAPRGCFFDRNYQLLAKSVPMDTVFVNPLHLRDRSVAAEILGPVLSLDVKKLKNRLDWAVEHNIGFLRIKRKINYAEAERLRAFKLDWIEFEVESQRRYPAGALGSHVLGFVGQDDQGEETGSGGLELSLDEELRGFYGNATATADVKHRSFRSSVTAAPVPGTSFVLTIDERIQAAAERELREAVEKNGCKSGSVVVMNPRNGDVLASASFPSYDPNTPPKKADLPNRVNQAVSVPFEPGSVYKVITLSAALETTNLTPDSIIDCGHGTISLFGRVIHEAKNGYGALSMRDVLAKSSNIGAIRIGMAVGEERLHEYACRFGFGTRTGIPLPAESPGVVRPLKQWGATTLASVAFGHEISTTTLQLARACSVIANGGLLVAPRLIVRRERQLEDRVVAEAEPLEPPKRILKAETAIQMRQMLEGVVLNGTGRAARLTGYTAGGKTGSAQIYDFKAKHYTHLYNSSFMGFAPVTSPAVVVVVTLNGASLFGGVVAAPVFQKVAMEALRVLEVPRDLPDEVQPAQETVEEAPDLEISALDPKPASADGALEGLSEAVSPEPPPVVAGPKVPNFVGKPMRTVMSEASEMGLKVEWEGSGIARAQQPPAGSALKSGELIRVSFAR